MLIGEIIFYKGRLCVRCDNFLGNHPDKPFKRFVTFPGCFEGSESDYRAIQQGPGLIGMKVRSFTDTCSNGDYKWYDCRYGHGHIHQLTTAKPYCDENKNLIVEEVEIPKPKSKLEVQWREMKDYWRGCQGYCWHKLMKSGWRPV